MKNGDNFHPSLFRVAKDCSVIDQNKGVHLPGASLEGAALSQNKIKEHLSTRHIVRIGTAVAEEPGSTPKDAPVVDLANPRLGQGVVTNDEGGHTQEDLLREGLVQAEDPEQHRIDMARGLSVTGQPKAIKPEDHIVPQGQQQQHRTAQASSPWTINPAELEGKSIDQLNVMVFERNPDQPMFETSEEATAFLSKDFKKQ